MENIENKLNNYRNRKKQRQRVQKLKERILDFVMIGNAQRKEIDSKSEFVTEDDTTLKLSDTESSNDDCNNIELTEVELSKKDVVLKYILWFVYLAFWITLFIIAIELQFGIVFLMFSALLFIYLNTRTGPRNKDEISAYSVFNKNCESIDGTLKGEQFERELGIR